MTDDFAALRPLLFTIAYEILGSAADAEDVLHDSYLRWHAVDPATVANPKAYLAQTVTRQSLNHLRSAQRRREEYVGTWLPEPIRVQPDVSEDAILAESVSVAMLLVLETLGPDERAVFVLHSVFGYAHGEIAELVGKSEANVRQIARRARKHVEARRARFEPSTDDAHRVIAAFMRASRTGDIATLMDLLAPDVVSISDGGGHISAARRPIVGADKVARFFVGVAQRKPPAGIPSFDVYNGLPAVKFCSDAGVESVTSFAVADGSITGIYIVLNPDKLATAVRPFEIRRD